MTKTRHTESGRSMTEMLSVLAIIGVLSIGVMVGYNYAVNKERANKIIYDGRSAYTFALSRVTKEEADEDSWLLIEGMPFESGKEFSYSIDRLGRIYILVDDVEEAVCEKLLDSSGERIHFYTEENDFFEECKDTNNMVIDFEDYGLMAECATATECEGEEAYCSNTNQCGNCAEGSEVNEAADGCQCSAGRDTTEWGCSCLQNTELSCSDKNGKHWCCRENKICGTEFGENQCVESDGTCSWNLTQETKSTCRWNLTQETKSTCRWNLTQETKATCSMTLGSTDSENNPPSISIDDSKCGTGEYCYVAFSNEGCSSGLGANVTGTLYGSCSQMNTHNTTCGNLTITETKGCGSGEYCYVAFSNEGCSSGLGANATGTLYGSCSQMNTHNTTCGSLEISEIQSCPAGEYCAIKYAKNTDCSTLGAAATGIVYGACALMNDNSPSCPY